MLANRVKAPGLVNSADKGAQKQPVRGPNEDELARDLSADNAPAVTNWMAAKLPVVAEVLATMVQPFWPKARLSASPLLKNARSLSNAGMSFFLVLWFFGFVVLWCHNTKKP